MTDVAVRSRFAPQILTGLLALVFAATACDDGSGPDPRVARVEVNLAPTLLLGTNAAAEARAFDIDGEEVMGLDAKWKSSAPGIVTIDRNGVMTGEDVGSAMISATIGGVAGTATIIVVPLPVASINIMPGGGTVDRGQTQQLTAILRDQFGDILTGRPVSWISSSPGIAQVTSAGLVVGIAAGTTEITASSENLSATVTMTVVVNPVPSGPVIESIEPALLVPGGTATITGANFGAGNEQNEVRIAGVPAAILTSSPTQLTVQLGASGYGCEPTRNVFVQVARGIAADAAPHLLQSAPQRTLQPGESVVLTNLGETRCFELSQTGGRYVVSVFNTSTNASATSEGAFRLRGALGVSPPGVAVAPVTSPPSAVRHAEPAVSPPLRDLLSSARARAERDAHARLLESNIQRVKRMIPDLTPAPMASAGARAAIVAGQPVGSTVSMKIPDVGGFLTNNFDYCRQHFTISARVVYNGTRAIVLEDAAAPLAAQMDTIFEKVGREVDDVMFEIDRQNFADPLRMDDVLDANGKVIMLFSPRVNSFAGIAGFVVSCDFETPQTSPSSNRAEVFYAVVPTDPGTDTTVERTRTGWYRTIRATVVHELKHIAAFANRIRDFGRSLEESWMEEGTARIAEEIWSRTAAYNGIVQRGNAEYANTVYCDWRPSNPNAPQCLGRPYAMGRSFRDFALYDFMKDPEQHSPMGPKLGTIDGSWYGTSWALLRWVADHVPADEATFFSNLVRTAQTGVANLSARAGRPWDEILGEWSLAMFTDDLPGFTPLNSRLSFPSWNLRSIYGGMHADFGPPLYNPPRFNPAFPLVPRQQSFGNFAVTVEKVLGGGFALFELTGAQTGRQLIQLLGPSGGEPSSRFRVAVVRIN